MTFDYSDGEYDVDVAVSYAACVAQQFGAKDLLSIQVELIRDGEAPETLRRYELKYSGDETRQRELVSVQQVHAEGLPATTFGYVEDAESPRELVAGPGGSYDADYGGVTVAWDYGEVTPSGNAWQDANSADTRVTKTTYHRPADPATSSWLLGRPLKGQTYDYASDINGDASLTKTLFAYDGQNCTDQALVTNPMGVLTRICQWDSKQAKYINATLAYDSTYGTLLETYATSQGSNDIRRHTQWTYDEDMHSLVRTVTNAAGHTSVNAAYDYRTGQPTLVYDANNQETDIEYDEFGRTTKVWRPLDIAYPDRPTVEYVYVGLGEPGTQHITTRRRKDHGESDVNGIWSQAFLDGFWRVVQTASEWTDRGSAGTSNPVK